MKNEKTGMKEYMIDIIPNDEDALREIDDPLKGDNPYENERMEELLQVAESIIGELPEVYDGIHINSIHWKPKGDDGDPDLDDVMLIQDRAQSTIK